MRDYLDAEFKPQPPPGAAGSAKPSVRSLLPFGYDLERIVDDFVFLCMLVGNDFLPSLPTLDIAEGALNTLFEVYKEELPGMGGYLTHAGTYDPARLRTILSRLGAVEETVLAARAKDAAEAAEKAARREARDARRGGAGGSGGGGGGGAGGGHRHPPQLPPLPPPPPVADDDSEWEDEAAFDAMLAAASGIPLAPSDVALIAPAASEAAAAPKPDPSMMRAEKRAFFDDGGGGLARWRAAYYAEKLELDASSSTEFAASLAGLCSDYAAGLSWVLQYYYRGVASWGWFFPHHYAPMASDLAAQPLATLSAASSPTSFDLGSPFSPFQQLLAVLPSASAVLLPPALRPLMLSPSSPISDFYPSSFPIDWEGKRSDWEGVVKVPFIDAPRLIAASSSVPSTAFLPEEASRNTPGLIYLFSFAPSLIDPYPSSLPRSFGPLSPCRCAVDSMTPPGAFPPDKPGFVPKLIPGTLLGSHAPPGFPTLKTIPGFVPSLQPAGCTVFGVPSRKPSLILALPGLGPCPPPAPDVASAVLGARVYVAWPYLREALCTGVSDCKSRLSVVAGGGTISGTKAFTQAESEAWRADAAKLSQRSLTSSGVDVGAVAVLLHVRVVEGLARHADGSLQKRFAPAETAFPLTATLRKPPGGAPDPRLEERAAPTPGTATDCSAAGASDGSALAPPPRAFGDAPRPGDTALFLGRSHFGALVVVTSGPSSAPDAAGTYSVAVTAFAPDGGAAARAFASAHHPRFERSGALARRLRLSPRALGQLTGTLWITLDGPGPSSPKLDVGLNLKNAKHGLAVPDFCRPTADDDGWEYSDDAARLISDYAARFPWLINALGAADDGPGGGGGGGGSGLDAASAMPESSPPEARAAVRSAASWVKAQPSSRRALVSTSSRVATPAALRLLLLTTASPPPPLPPVGLERVSPLLLLPPCGPRDAASVLCGGDFELGDRIAVTSPASPATGAPPFGSRGTVVGIHPWTVGSSLELLMDFEFDGGSDLHGRVPPRRGALLPSDSALNLTRPPPLPALGAWAPPVRASAEVQRALAAAAAAPTGLAAWPMPQQEAAVAVRAEAPPPPPPPAQPQAQPPHVPQPRRGAAPPPTQQPLQPHQPPPQPHVVRPSVASLPAAPPRRAPGGLLAAAKAALSQLVPPPHHHAPGAPQPRLPPQPLPPVAPAAAPAHAANGKAKPPPPHPHTQPLPQPQQPQQPQPGSSASAAAGAAAPAPDAAALSAMHLAPSDAAAAAAASSAPAGAAPPPSGFRFTATQGRGRGRGAVAYADGRAVPPQPQPQQQPPAAPGSKPRPQPRPQPQPPVPAPPTPVAMPLTAAPPPPSSPGAAILAMLQGGAAQPRQPPPPPSQQQPSLPPPQNGGAVLMGLLRGGAAATATTAAPASASDSSRRGGVDADAQAFWSSLVAGSAAPA